MILLCIDFPFVDAESKFSFHPEAIGCYLSRSSCFFPHQQHSRIGSRPCPEPLNIVPASDALLLEMLGSNILRVRLR